MIATGSFTYAYVHLLLVILVPAGLLIAWRVNRKRARRARIRQPFSANERAVLDHHFPRYLSLPEALRSRHEAYTRVLMEDKNFEPCGDLSEVTEEMKLVIAAQAAILLLELPDHRFYPRLKSILVYPGAFHDPGRRNFGLAEADDRGVLLGESWETGSVILSWDSVVAGGQNDDDGMNVVFHEFAHQLDQYNGEADGVPLLRDRAAYAGWSEVLGREFAKLVEETGKRGGHGTFLDPYGATDPAEFFAVASETFFEDPGDLKLEHPELYAQLRGYYGLDPAAW